MNKKHENNQRTERNDRNEKSGFSLKALPLANIGFFAVAGIAVYGLYRYRFQIQSMLEEVGIDTPWLTGSPVDAFRSGVAKIDGSIRNDTKSGAM